MTLIGYTMMCERAGPKQLVHDPYDAFGRERTSGAPPSSGRRGCSTGRVRCALHLRINRRAHALFLIRS